MRYIVVVVALAALALGCTSMEDMFGNGHSNKNAGIPPMHDCQEHFNRCLESPIQSISGGSAGSSRCSDCHNLCRGNLLWPEQLEGGAGDCQWWKH